MMRGLISRWIRGALGLGAALLLGLGWPGSGLAAAAPERLMAQAAAPEKAAETPEQRRTKEQLRRKMGQPPRAPAPRTMEEGRRESAAPPREVPAKAGTQKFGGQTIRAKEPPQGE